MSEPKMMHRVLIVGGGSIGERHLRCFLETGRAEVGLCDNRPQRLAEVGARYPVSATFLDLDEINLSEFDAAVVCVPTHLHVLLARRLADAGTHVLIEKPLSVNLDGIDDLAQAAEDKGLVIGVAFVRRAMRLYRAAYRVLAAARIGDVLSATCSVGCDHRMTRPDYAETYFARRETGGGAIHDILSHFIDLFQWFLGPVEQVICSHDHLEIEGTDAEDTASVLLRCRRNGAMVNLHANLWQAHREETITLSAKNGSIVCDRISGRMGVFPRQSGTWNWTKDSPEQPDSKGQVDGPFIFQANNFLDAIEGKSEVLCTLGEARHTVAVCRAALESGRRRCAVSVQPEETR